MAPEICRNNTLPKAKAPLYHDVVDIYSLGILILVMLGIEVPPIELPTRKAFKNHITSLVIDKLDECSKDDPDRLGALTTAERMLQFEPEYRPSVNECLRYAWLNPPTVASPTMQLSRAPSSLSTRDGPAQLPSEPAEDWWSTNSKGTRESKLKERKKMQQKHPISTASKNKVQKRRRNPLPTPRATPLKKHRARKFDEEEPKDATALESWEMDTEN